MADFEVPTPPLLSRGIDPRRRKCIVLLVLVVLFLLAARTIASFVI